jgi:hypothetical protein
MSYNPLGTSRCRTPIRYTARLRLRLLVRRFKRQTALQTSHCPHSSDSDHTPTFPNNSSQAPATAILATKKTSILAPQTHSWIPDEARPIVATRLYIRPTSSTTDRTMNLYTCPWVPDPSSPPTDSKLSPHTKSLACQILSATTSPTKTYTRADTHPILSNKQRIRELDNIRSAHLRIITISTLTNLTGQTFQIKDTAGHHSL